jgi:hypothetical protein
LLGHSSDILMYVSEMKMFFITSFIFFIYVSALQADVFTHISANRSAIENASCQHENIDMNVSDYEESLEQMRAGLKTMTRSVGGTTFWNQPALFINVYRELTSYKNYKLRSSKDIDFWHLFKNRPCETTLCAAQKVFGEEKGAFYLAFMAKTGLNLSPLGYDRLKAPVFRGETKPSDETLKEFRSLYMVRTWQDHELDPYLKAVMSLPAHFFPLPATRFLPAKHAHHKGDHLHANATMLFYPNLFKQDKAYQRYTTVHELAHVISSAQGFDFDKEWIGLSWKKSIDGKTFVHKNDHFVSAYAKATFFEDFAESFAAFRFNPSKLKKLAPLKYEYMKNKVFKGHSYLETSECPESIF